MRKPAETLTVAFTPLQVVMAAHFVHYDMPDVPNGIELEMKPVLGVLLKHDINERGEITGDRQEMAIQSGDSQTLCTPQEYVDNSGEGSVLVGIYPYKLKAEPDEEEIQGAVDFDRREAARRAKGATS